MTIVGVLVGLLLLSCMMVIHEAGHFFAGRALGFKIISYNIFMGPILWQRRGRDGIRYTIRAFPIGASVEFAGEMGEDETDSEGESRDLEEDEQAERIDPNDPGLFTNRPRWARAIVIAMGPLLNFLSAFLAFVLLFGFFGTALPVISKVNADTRAADSGLEVGDRIVQVNGYKVRTMLDYSMGRMLTDDQTPFLMKVQKANGDLVEEMISPLYEFKRMLGFNYELNSAGEYKVVRVMLGSNGGNPLLKIGDVVLSVDGVSCLDKEGFSAAIQEAQGGTVKLKIRRDGQEIVLDHETTTYISVPDGITFEAAEDTGDILGQALYQPISVVRATIKGLGMIVSGKLSARDGFTGPIGIVTMVGGVVSLKVQLAEKINQLLMLFGLISVAIGFTNLLPIPPFDGHHLMVLGIEGIRRKDLPLKFKNAVAFIGFGLMILLAVLVTMLDIGRLIG